MHPRACGGNRCPSAEDSGQVGASPRLRGKRAVKPCSSTSARCIPAPAGETQPSPRPPGPSPVHPRACGGNGFGGGCGAWWRGASPRLRGKPPPSWPSSLRAGCIPAPAGETPPRTPPPPTPWVHPRACGGNAPLEVVRGPVSGASPRLRGKQLGGAAEPETLRCIPAPAGETGLCRPSPVGVGVHPRACGGNDRKMPSASAPNGASPRLRGKHGLRPLRLPQVRCIPAPAGETRRGSARPPPPPVHPRACGGNPLYPGACRLAAGASPRLRGKLSRTVRGCGGVRCIPAPAGETEAVAQEASDPEVHPRACGGNRHAVSASRSRYGASPRLRGKLDGVPVVPVREGCIPAPAGETRARSSRPGETAVHPRACGGNPSCHNCHIFVIVRPSSPGSQPRSPRRWLQGLPPNHIDAVVLHDLLRRLSQCANRLSSSRCRSRPSHDDRSFPVVGPPVRQHGPYSFPNRCGHVRLRVHAGRDLKHA